MVKNSCINCDLTHIIGDCPPIKRNIKDFKPIKDLECAFCEKKGTHWLMEAESPDDSIGKRTLVCEEHYEAIKNKNE